MAFALARRAGDVAPYHGRVVGAGAMCAYVVGADVPAARAPVGVPDVVPWASRGEKWMGAVRFRFMKRGRFAIMESD